MASPRLKREQSFDFEEPNAQAEAMGSASASYSPPGGVFGLSAPESSPQEGRKRRKDRPSWTKHTFTPHFDGHLWRKYGQKNIKDSAFPRLYYRCSYREDQNCPAAKLVQQDNDDDPPLYKVTYMYEHTCNAAPVPTPDVVAWPLAAGEPYYLCFDPTGGHTNTAQTQEGPYDQSTSRRPFLMLSFDPNSRQEHPVLPPEPPPAVATASTSFPADGGDGSRDVQAFAPTASNDMGGDMFSTWDSFRFGLGDHLHFGDHMHFPGNSDDGNNN